MKYEVVNTVLIDFALNLQDILVCAILRDSNNNIEFAPRSRVLELINTGEIEQDIDLLEKLNNISIGLEQISDRLNKLSGKILNRAGNMERARKWVQKYKILGKEVKLKILSDNDIRLLKAPDGTGTFEIPDFITSLESTETLSTSPKIHYPFEGTHYSKIIVNGSLTSMSKAFAKIESDSIEIVFNKQYTIYSLQGLFWESKLLKRIKLSGQRVTGIMTAEALFYSCLSLENIEGLEVLDTSNVVIATGMFYKCSNIQYLDISKLNFSDLIYGKGMFEECTRLREIQLCPEFLGKYLETAESMFKNNSCLDSIDLSNQNPGHLENVAWMFSGCTFLSKVNLKGTIFKKLRQANKVFSGCINLEEIDLSGNEFRALEFAERAFYGCSLLRELNIIDTEAPNLKAIAEMFSRCSGLKQINTPKLCAKHITSADKLYSNCISLEYLDTGSLGMEVYNTPVEAFKNCKNLHTFKTKCQALIFAAENANRQLE